MDILLLILLLLIVAIAIGGVVAVLLADEPEEGLFLKGMGYALLGNFLITIGPIPIPLTQILGAVMAARAEVNNRSRWAAWGVGLALRLVPLGLFFE